MHFVICRIVGVMDGGTDISYFHIVGDDGFFRRSDIMAVSKDSQFAVGVFGFYRIGIFCGIAEKEFCSLCFVIAVFFQHGSAFFAMAGGAGNESVVAGEINIIVFWRAGAESFCRFFISCVIVGDILHHLIEDGVA